MSVTTTVRNSPTIFPSGKKCECDCLVPWLNSYVSVQREHGKQIFLMNPTKVEGTCAMNFCHFLALSLKELFMTPSYCLVVSSAPPLLSFSNKRSASITALRCCPCPYIMNSDVRPSLQKIIRKKWKKSNVYIIQTFKYLQSE